MRDEASGEGTVVDNEGSRRGALRAVLDAEGDVRFLVRALEPFRPVDVDPVVTMTHRHVVRVLERYLAGELSAEDVSVWAEALEYREDVEFPEDEPDFIGFVCDLATEGSWARPITPEIALRFVEALTV